VGKGSTYLYSLKAGDSVRFSGPFGDFSLRPGGHEKVFIGGGAGMAPLRAMVHACLDGGASERIHFWYGARNLREAPYVEEMAALADAHPNFSWHLVLSEDAQCGAGLLKGLVHEAAHESLLRDHPDLHACDFYLCGPPAMLSATRQLLKRLGVAEERVAFDDFKI
jgi:Na(+)-translocating NADH:ubiquinone oxidoreductase F subunit